nr:hypothetical protein [Pandoravirus belohorizontensis]
MWRLWPARWPWTREGHDSARACGGIDGRKGINIANPKAARTKGKTEERPRRHEAQPKKARADKGNPRKAGKKRKGGEEMESQAMAATAERPAAGPIPCVVEYRVERDEGLLPNARWATAETDCGHRFHAAGGSAAQLLQRIRERAAACGCAPAVLVDGDGPWRH